MSPGLGEDNNQAGTLQSFTCSGTKITRSLNETKSGWSGIERDDSLVEVCKQDDEPCSKPGESTPPAHEIDEQLVKASTDKCNSFTGHKLVGHHYLGYAQVKKK